MSDIEKRLTELGEIYSQVKTPEDMEERLRCSVRQQSARSKPGFKWVAAAVVVFLLFGYSWDALAYYSKKILGYDQVMSGSVQGQFSQGKGQLIGKSARFTNGVVITLDALIMDGQGFTTLVKIDYPKGYQREPGDSVQLELKGILRYVRGGGAGEIKGDSEYWVRSFDQEPMLLEKRMALVVNKTINGSLETVSIPFTLNRSQAYIPTVGAKRIDKKLVTAYGTIYFDTLKATGLSTVVSGHINDAKLLSPQLTGRTLHFIFALNQNNIMLPIEASSFSSQNDKDFKFEIKFAGTKILSKFKISDIRFEENIEIDQEVNLLPNMTSVSFGNGSDLITMEKVTVEGN
ncbi:MAG: DUF4179 domain-containing protein, partial [Methylocystaceae bacterium]